MKYNKDYRYYDIIISNKQYRIVARSRLEAINVVRFKFCYLNCLQQVSHFSLIDRIELKRSIKEFDFTLIKYIKEGEIVERGSMSMDKRQTTRQWVLLKEFHYEMLLADMERHENQIGGTQ